MRRFPRHRRPGSTKQDISGALRVEGRRNGRNIAFAREATSFLIFVGTRPIARRPTAATVCADLQGAFAVREFPTACGKPGPSAGG